MKRSLSLALVGFFVLSLSACGEDATNPPTNSEIGDDAGMSGLDMSEPTDAAQSGEDAGDGEADMDGSGDMGPDANLLDMAPDLPQGPREELEFLGASVVEELRLQYVGLADDGVGGWYVGGASAGRDVVFAPGEAEETIIDTAGLDGFRAIFAHYDGDGVLQNAYSFTEYAGGPLPGGTAQAGDLAVQPDGTVLMGGSFGASVRFAGTTVWSTPQGDVGGAIATSYETFVVRIDPTTDNVAPLFRLQSPSPGESNVLVDLVAHDDSDFTISGYFQTSVAFPDSTTLTGPTAGSSGYLARFDTAGQLLWAQKTPSFTYATDLDGDSVITRFSYANEFTLDDTLYGAPAQGARGFAMARVDANGSVVWMIRAEGAATPYIHEPVVGPNGNLFVGARLQDATFPDTNPQPTIAGSHGVILEIDPADGSIVDSMPLGFVEDDYLEAPQIIFDEFGILWAYVGYGPSVPVELKPAYGDAFVVPYEDPNVDGDGHNLMLGWDWADKSLAYAYFASTSTSASAFDILLLTGGQILVADRYFYQRTLDPMGPSPLVLDNNVDGRDPDTAFIRFR